MKGVQKKDASLYSFSPGQKNLFNKLPALSEENGEIFSSIDGCTAARPLLLVSCHRSNNGTTYVLHPEGLNQFSSTPSRGVVPCTRDWPNKSSPKTWLPGNEGKGKRRERVRQRSSDRATERPSGRYRSVELQSTRSRI